MRKYIFKYSQIQPILKKANSKFNHSSVLKRKQRSNQIIITHIILKQIYTFCTDIARYDCTVASQGKSNNVQIIQTNL